MGCLHLHVAGPSSLPVAVAQSFVRSLITSILSSLMKDIQTEHEFIRIYKIISPGVQKCGYVLASCDPKVYMHKRNLLRLIHMNNGWQSLYIFFCWFQVVTINRERLISEKQNSKASPTGARLPKEAMLLRDIYKFTKPALDVFRPFGLISRACQGPRGPPNSINVDHYKTD